MNKYNGILKSKKQAEKWIEILSKIWTEEAQGAAKLLANNWQSVASRPSLAAEINDIVNGKR